LGILLLAIPLKAEATTEYRKVESPYVVQATPAEITKTKIKYGTPSAGNCVKYARSVRPDLPQGLWTLRQKQNIIKTKTPSVGAVAITAEGGSGHLSIVLKVEDENLLIRESGYTKGISERWIPREKIIGFF